MKVLKGDIKKACENTEEFNTCTKKIKDVIENCINTQRYYDNYVGDYYCPKDPNNFNFYQIFNFIKHIRNALSHSGNHCLFFLTDSNNNKITDVIFKDFYGNKNFILQLKIEELLILRETIAKIFVMLEQILKDFVEQYDLVYDNDIAELQSKMQKFYKVNKN